MSALDDVAALPWLQQVFAQAQVDAFASTHTCLPALRTLGRPGAPPLVVANSGAAGMPNFRGDLRGLCTRIATTPAPGPVVHELQTGGVYIALLPLAYDTPRWQLEFEAQWPPGSPAHDSYFDRITRGPAYAPEAAAPRQLG